MTPEFFTHVASAYRFTPAQAQIFPYLCKRLTYVEIGEQVGINGRGAQRHASLIFSKIGVVRRSEFMNWVEAENAKFLTESNGPTRDLQILKEAVRNYFAEDSDVLTAETRLLELVNDA